MVQAFADESAVEGEHEPRDYLEQLARLSVEDPVAIRRTLITIAHQLLEERPEIASMPDVAVAVGLCYGFAVGVRAQPADAGK